MANCQFTMESIERIGRLENVAEVERELGKAVSYFDFTGFCLLDLPAQATDANPTFVLDTMPAGWREFYIEGKFYEHDHIVRYGKTASRSFDFRTAPYGPSEEKSARRLLEALAHFGIPGGLIVPLTPICDKPCGACLTGARINPNSVATRDAEILILYAAYRLRALFNHNPATPARRLSPHEREVLQWSAKGKTAWEIGEILQISEAAVNKLIAATMTKLDTASKTQAVVMAIRNREIDP